VAVPCPFRPARVEGGTKAMILGRARSSFHAASSIGVSPLVWASVMALAVRCSRCAKPDVHCGGRFTMVGGRVKMSSHGTVVHHSMLVMVVYAVAVSTSGSVGWIVGTAGGVMSMTSSVVGRHGRTSRSGRGRPSVVVMDLRSDCRFFRCCRVSSARARLVSSRLVMSMCGYWRMKQ
jgi:hypothetical protein